MGGNGGSQGNGDLSTLPLNGAGAEGPTESVSVSGAQGRTQDFGMGNEEELQQRIQEFRDRMQREGGAFGMPPRSEEHTSELQSRLHLVCRLLLEKKKKFYSRTAACCQHGTSVLSPGEQNSVVLRLVVSTSASLAMIRLFKFTPGHVFVMMPLCRY